MKVTPTLFVLQSSNILLAIDSMRVFLLLLPFPTHHGHKEAVAVRGNPNRLIVGLEIVVHFLLMGVHCC